MQKRQNQGLMLIWVKKGMWSLKWNKWVLPKLNEPNSSKRVRQRVYRLKFHSLEPIAKS